MRIVQCPYCNMDTGGNHEFDCPTNPHRVVMFDFDEEAYDLSEPEQIKKTAKIIDPFSILGGGNI